MISRHYKSHNLLGKISPRDAVRAVTCDLCGNLRSPTMEYGKRSIVAISPHSITAANIPAVTALFSVAAAVVKRRTSTLGRRFPGRVHFRAFNRRAEMVSGKSPRRRRSHRDQTAVKGEAMPGFMIINKKQRVVVFFGGK